MGYHAISRVAVLGLFLCASSGFAEAQSARPMRPYRGLFGGNGVGSGKLDFTLSTYSGYDDDLLTRSGSRPDSRFRLRGYFAGADATLAYAKPGDRVSLDVTSGTVLRYFPQLDRVEVITQVVQAGLSVGLTRRTRFSLSQQAAYHPWYVPTGANSLGSVPSGAVDLSLAGPDFAISDFSSYTFASTARLTQTLSRRSSVTAFYRFRYNDTGRQASDSRVQGGGGRFDHRLTRGASFHAGYGYRVATYDGEGRTVRVHDLDVGVDYSRALSLSRRTVLRFGSGSSLIVRDRARGAEGRGAQASLYRVLGFAALSHQIGRSWTAQLTYRRETAFLDGLSEPLFVDGVTAELGGALGRRTRLSARAGYSNGSVGFGGRNNRRLESYVASLRLQAALTRYLAFYTQFLYYHQLFDETVELPVGIGRGLDRKGVRVGLTLWLPLLD